MAKLNSARSAQYVMEGQLTVNFDDTIVDVAGVEKAFSDDVTAAVVNLPEGAVIIGGELVVDTAYAGVTTATLSLGDSVSATRYASAVDLKTAGHTALTLTGFSTTENLRATLAATGSAATAGKFSVRVMYVMPGRANEAVPG